MTERTTLDSIHATHVDVHIEHMHRGHYHLSLSRAEANWGLSMLSNGYIKTRICNACDAVVERSSKFNSPK